MANEITFIVHDMILPGMLSNKIKREVGKDYIVDWSCFIKTKRNRIIVVSEEPLVRSISLPIINIKEYEFD